VWQSADPILGSYLPDMPKIEDRLSKKRSESVTTYSMLNVERYFPLLATWKPENELRGGGGVYRSTNLALYTYVNDNPVLLVDPTGLAWIFSQSSGQWSHRDNQTGATTPVGQGYSGAGEGRNNPAMQNVPDVGPTPQGTYDIGPGHPSDTTGPNTMNLTPSPGTNTFGRDLFRIHGNNAENDASTGCPIAPPNVRQQINNSTDRVLQVVP
jgi:hypothetical protein